MVDILIVLRFGENPTFHIGQSGYKGIAIPVTFLFKDPVLTVNEHLTQMSNVDLDDSLFIVNINVKYTYKHKVQVQDWCADLTLVASNLNPYFVLIYPFDFCLYKSN